MGGDHSPEILAVYESQWEITCVDNVVDGLGGDSVGKD